MGRSKEMRSKWTQQIQTVVGKEEIQVINRNSNGSQRAQSDIVTAIKSTNTKQPRSARAFSVIHSHNRPRLSLKVMMPRLKKSNSMTVSDDDSNAKVDQ